MFAECALMVNHLELVVNLRAKENDEDIKEEKEQARKELSDILNSVEKMYLNSGFEIGTNTIDNRAIEVEWVKEILNDISKTS